MAKRVVVIFPKFERLDLIEQIRSVFDPLAASVKAHITLMPPFEDDVSPEQLHSHIEQAIQNIQPFHINLQSITGHEGEYLFLNVKRGNDKLIELRDKLYSGILATHFLPQYTYVPHLTVGRLTNQKLFLEAVATAQEVTATFETQISKVSVYSIQSNGTRPIDFNIPL